MSKQLGEVFGIEIIPGKGFRLTFIDHFGDYIRQDFKTMDLMLKEIQTRLDIIALENNLKKVEVGMYE